MKVAPDADEQEEEEEPFLVKLKPLGNSSSSPSSPSVRSTRRVLCLTLILLLMLLYVGILFFWEEGAELAEWLGGVVLGTSGGGGIFSSLKEGGSGPRSSRSHANGKCNVRTCQQRFFAQGSWQHDPTRLRTEAQYAFPHGGPPKETPSYAQYDWMVATTSTTTQEEEEDIYSCCPPIAQPYFDAEAFCNVLQDLEINSILVVGDSITQQLTQSLYLMVEGSPQTAKPQDERAWDPYNPAWEHFPEAFGIFTHESTPWHGTLCGDINPTPTQLTLVRNDLLYVNETYIDAFDPSQDVGPYDNGGFWEWSFSRPWTPFLQERDVDLLLLNAGAHIHDEPLYQRTTNVLLDYLEEHYLNDDEGKEEEETKHKKKKRVIYRSTNPGHPACMTYDAPTAPDKEWNYDEVGDFSWGMFAQYNNYTRTALETRFSGEVGWLDSATLTRDRPDGHFGADDCLHYNCPGPVDAWNVALLHMLETERAFG